MYIIVKQVQVKGPRGPQKFSPAQYAIFNTTPPDLLKKISIN
jgi:hypothetical protein